MNVLSFLAVQSNLIRYLKQLPVQARYFYRNIQGLLHEVILLRSVGWVEGMECDFSLITFTFRVMLSLTRRTTVHIRLDAFHLKSIFFLFLVTTYSAKVAEEKIRYAAYNCLAIDTDVSPWEE